MCGFRLQPEEFSKIFRLISVRQGYGGPPKRFRAKAEGGSHPAR
jgi:hypothetical protein